MFTDDRIGELLDELQPLQESLPYDSDDASLIRVARRGLGQGTACPGGSRGGDGQGCLGGHGGLGRRAGRQRLRSFRPWLDRHLELKHRYIACFDPGEEPYDTLLDDFEPGTTTAEVRDVFDRLKEELVPLIAAGRDRATSRSRPARSP